MVVLSAGWLIFGVYNIIPEMIMLVAFSTEVVQHFTGTVCVLCREYPFFKDGRRFKLRYRVDYSSISACESIVIRKDLEVFDISSKRDPRSIGGE